MSVTETINSQANLYLFDLQNYARENGCYIDDSWQVRQVTFDEKAALERSYQLTLCSKYLPEEITGLLQVLELKLNPMKQASLTSDKKEGQYLIAFHSEKLKR